MRLILNIEDFAHLEFLDSRIDDDRYDHYKMNVIIEAWYDHELIQCEFYRETYQMTSAMIDGVDHVTVTVKMREIGYFTYQTEETQAKFIPVVSLPPAEDPSHLSKYGGRNDSIIAFEVL